MSTPPPDDRTGPADPAITPDDKDWTWTLRERCPECGFTAADVTAAEIAGLLRAFTDPWPTVLARPDAGQRPAPSTWSPLEYACHVRDVCRLFEHRLRLMLTHDAPTFDNWDQDETAVADRYAEQDPATVAGEITASGTSFARAYAQVPGDGWARTGIRSNGSEFTVLTLGQYGLHDLRHHLWDVGVDSPVKAELVYLLLGGSLLLAAVLPQLLHRWALSAPIVLVATGMVIGLLPQLSEVELDPVAARPVIEHVTEITVLVALMGVGLALDRPLRWRSRESWRAWSPAWRLLGIAMPLTIGTVALLAWGPLGVAAPAALLLGAALSPTDPVLASDVQVEGPTLEGDAEEIDEDDEVRFALTSEAGLNDGLAFPFVYAAIFLATLGPVSQWGLEWVAWELVGKVVVGVLVGVAVGWAMARLAFRSPARSLRLAEVGEPLLALAALLVAYGASELVGGYGFLAVFACALTVRSVERDHDYHRHMHDVINRLETLLTLVVLLGLGFALTNGLLTHLDWRGVLVALALVLVIRPLAGWLSFLGHRTQVGATAGLDHRERLVVAFFGVRGVGSIYYVAYAAGAASFPEERWLWSTVGFTVALSVVLHGILATPVMRRLDRRRDDAGRNAGARRGDPAPH